MEFGPAIVFALMIAGIFYFYFLACITLYPSILGFATGRMLVVYTLNSLFARAICRIVSLPSLQDTNSRHLSNPNVESEPWQKLLSK